MDCLLSSMSTTLHSAIWLSSCPIRRPMACRSASMALTEYFCEAKLEVESSYPCELVPEVPSGRSS